jgi:hypothetical protein
MRILTSIVTVLIIYALCIVLWGTVVFDITVDTLTWIFRILGRVLDGFEGVLNR